MPNDGVSMTGDGAVQVDASQATGPKTGADTDMTQFIDVNNRGSGGDIGTDGQQQNDSPDPDIVAGRNGVVVEGEEEAAAAAPEGEQAQDPAAEAAAQDPAAAQKPAAGPMDNPAVRALVEPLQQQNQLMQQSLQQMHSMMQAAQQENLAFKQQILQMAQTAQQQKAEAARQAQAPRPPPEGAGEAEQLRYEQAKMQWSHEEKMAAMEARLHGYEQAAREQVQAIQQQAVQAQQSAQLAAWQAQYDAGMAQIRNAQNYYFLRDGSAKHPETGQPANVGEYLFSTVYNSWASAEMAQAQANGTAYRPPDPVALANLLHGYVESLVKQRGNPGKQQQVQAAAVQQQRAQQQQRTEKVRGVAPMRAQQGQQKPQKDMEALRKKYLLPEGERAIFPG
jgi:hypothetical protein